MSLAAWIRAARPLAHANIAPPILLGQALCAAQGHALDPSLFAAAHLFGALDHLYIVFANDYADRELDATNTTYTAFSGGSRVLPEGLLRPAQIRAAAIASAIALVALSGAIALWLDRPLAPAFAAGAIALLWAYSYPPLALSYAGLGELAQAVGVGLVLPLLGYYLQRGSLAAMPWPALAPLFVMGLASNVLTSLPDTPSDAAFGKKTWSVRRGARRARIEAVMLVGLGLSLFALLAGLSAALTACVLVPASVMLLASLRWIGRADPERKQDCVRFVFAASGAIPIAELGWAIALLS